VVAGEFDELGHKAGQYSSGPCVAPIAVKSEPECD
jgi:hypothetical protein